MAQGQLSGDKSFLYFDGWKAVILHSCEFGNNLGSCGRKETGRPCYSTDVTWTFTDLAGDMSDDVVESTNQGVGEDGDCVTWKTVVNTYMLKDKQSVPASPELVQSHRARLQRHAESDQSSSNAMEGNRGSE